MGKANEKVYELAAGVANSHGVELFGLELLGRGRRSLLRITIDKEGGVTLNDCERFSRDIEALLDVEDAINGPYTLEVSSPGIDRPLRGVEDYRRSIGKLVRVITVEKVDNMSFFVGRLKDVGEDRITLLLEGGKEVELTFDDISRARLEVEIK